MGLFDNYTEQYGYNPNPFEPEAQHYEGQIEEVTLPSGRTVLQVWVADLDAYGQRTGGLHPEYQTSYNGSSSGSGGSTGMSSESYGLESRGLDITQQHYQNQDALDALAEDRQRLDSEWQRAVQEGNLALARQIEQRTAANEAQSLALQQQQLQLDAALGQAQVGASVYGTQTQGRSSLANTMVNAATAAGEAQANPWNPMGYLTNVASSGGATPYSNMTPGQYTGYRNQMDENWLNTFAPLSEKLNQGWESTYDTPQGITDALAQMQPQTIVPQTPTQIALARYKSSTAGEKKALAGASPEALRILWEAGQRR